jgi:hypothetical protein
MNGAVVSFYAFDVANDVRTERIGEVLSCRPAPFEVRSGPGLPRDIRIYRPLTVELPPLIAQAEAGPPAPIPLTPRVRIFEGGMLSISYEAACRDVRLSDLVRYHQMTVEGAPLAQRAEELCQAVVESLRDALVAPTETRPPAEAYTVFCLRDLDLGAATSTVEWLGGHRAEVAGLLAEETRPDRLSSSQVDETLRHALSYTVHDLAVVDWDAALVVDQSGYFDDVLYVMEVANVQLEQLRLLDDGLDTLFQRAYDDLQRRARRGIGRRSSRTLERLRSIRLDVTRISEEVTNITKFVGDWYLARVYLACKDRFHLPHWEGSVDQKLRQLDDLYSIVQSELNNRRMLLMEATIIVLFVLDLAIIFFKG